MSKKDGQIRCPLCGSGVAARLARGRKSGKPFILLVCPKDARHFRGFIGDQQYVKQVIEGQLDVLETPDMTLLRDKGRP